MADGALEHGDLPLLLKSPSPAPENPDPARRRQPGKAALITGVFYLCVAFAVLVVISSRPPPARRIRPPAPAPVEFGVSEKRSRVGSLSYPWTNAMLAWQRTAFHFQPEKNWMNDPNGPLYHMGWYHIFYQYNPDSPLWGNITWGHAASTDLINWLHLPIALTPDQPYDLNGVWTGSATILPDGTILILYTGSTVDLLQVQNLAYPANLSDPLLLTWLKHPSNPLITPPNRIAPKDFRDPTTAWLGPDGLWRLALGSKIGTTGVALVYKTANFTTFEVIEDRLLHAVAGTGMWECVDFFPVSTTGLTGLDTSVDGPDVKHVLKASLDDNRKDWYAIGTYHAENDTWSPDDPELDVGVGLRVDYGKYYASKSFYDHSKARRVLWGWIGESDSEISDLDKGWASIQAIPRTVTFDTKTRANILQWPVKEVETLRSSHTEFKDVLLEPGSVVDLGISSATQMDISVEFTVDRSALNSTVSSDAINNCSATFIRGALGPFGLLVLSDESLTELTPVYFYIAKAPDGTVKNWFCTDRSRSTKATDVDLEIYGGPVPVLQDENYTMRLLVDHSVVEAFGQGGRTIISSRVYPTRAIYRGARLFLFNNATHLNVTASLKAWRMSSAKLRPYPLHQA